MKFWNYLYILDLDSFSEHKNNMCTVLKIGKIICDSKPYGLLVCKMNIELYTKKYN
jgi:hypothetical protein